jgi:pyruvate dehydrogenase (quinone)
VNQTVADIIVETLRAAGARRCYGVLEDTPGAFTDAVMRSEVRWVHVRHEDVGAMAAGADAMLTGQLALCARSCGPGSLHFINDLFESHRNRAPVVLIASQSAWDDFGLELLQEVDFKAIYGASNIYCDEIRTPSQARHRTMMAAQAALSRRGLAVLVVPEDVLIAKAPDQPHVMRHTARHVMRPDDKELDAIVAALNMGNRILIYGGSGCEAVHDQVVELAARLNAPVARTSRAKDFLGYENPFDVGMTGVFGSDGAEHALMHCDTVVLLGCDFPWREFFPTEARIVQIDVDVARSRRSHRVDVGVAGDIAATLDALLPRTRQRSSRHFLDETLVHARNGFSRQERQAVAGTSGTIQPQYLAKLVARHAQHDAVFAADAGTPMVWCLRHVPATGQNRTLCSLPHATMAAAMPQALGAQAAFPDRQVVSMSSDRGLAMSLGDLITTVQGQLPVKVVVFNNSALGFLGLEQKVGKQPRVYTHLENPDFCRIAEAIGMWSRRVEEPAKLDAAVQAWLAEPGPALLDVVTNRHELVTPPAVHTGKVLGKVLYSPKALLGGGAEQGFELVNGAMIE